MLPAGTRMQVFSEDLSSALLWAYDLPAVSDDTPDRQNFYSMDTQTGGLRAISVTQFEPLTVFDFLNKALAGVSDDAKHLGFVTTTRMHPDAVADVPNVYKWDDGVLSVAGKLPDGSVPAAGATVGPVDIRETMSADGSRLAFVSTGDGSRPRQLYLHVDGRESVWISQPEGSDQDDPQNVQFEGMTPDGKSVFFTSDSALLDGDDADGPDLYRFTESADPSSDANLTLITDDGSASSFPADLGSPLVGMSDDGRRVYVHSDGGKLLLWEEGVGIRTIVSSLSRIPNVHQNLGLTATWPGNARVSSDGNWLAYIFHDEGGGVPDRMYVYSRRDDEVTCVSCPSTASLVPTLTRTGRDDYIGFRPRFLSDDGKVFFTSPGALVAGDTNGVDDVYEYDGQTGTLSLLSSGKGSEATQFVGTSASGDDVFVVTRQQLVADDTDDYIDLYDVRVGAGAPGQPALVAPACEGDGCQGAPSGAPADGALGSITLEGDESSGPGARRLGLVVRRRVAFRGAVGLLSARLGSAGRLRWSGRGLVGRSAKRGSAGRVRLRVRLDRRARARLVRSGRYATTLKLTVVGADGARATRAVRVTFRAAGKGR